MRIVYVCSAGRASYIALFVHLSRVVPSAKRAIISMMENV